MHFLINSIFIAVLFGLHFGNQQQWYAPASAIKNQLGMCQTSKVIAEDFGSDVLRFGYEYTAKKFRIPTKDLNLKNDNHELRECPDVIWVEASPVIGVEQLTVPSLHEQLAISQERERDIRNFLSRNPQYINHNISLEIFNEGRAWRGFVFLVEK